MQNKGEKKMRNLPDDPIIACIERTGYPWWMLGDDDDDEDEYRRVPYAIYDPE